MAIKTTRKTPTEDSARTASIAWTALEKVAGKESCRGLLEAGSSTPVKLQIEGKIDRTPIAIAFAGNLNVGHDSTVNQSSACNSAHLVAYLLSMLDERSREMILKHMPDDFLSTGHLPTVDATILARAETLLTQLRSRSSVKRLGSVSFERGS